MSTTSESLQYQLMGSNRSMGIWVCEIQEQCYHCPEHSVIKDGRTDSDGYRFREGFYLKAILCLVAYMMCVTSGCFNWSQMCLIKVNIAKRGHRKMFYALGEKTQFFLPGNTIFQSPVKTLLCLNQLKCLTGYIIGCIYCRGLCSIYPVAS